MRSPFALSFDRYRRQLLFTDHGGIAGRVPNPLVHPNTPPHILALLSHYERAEMAAVARYHKEKPKQRG